MNVASALVRFDPQTRRVAARLALAIGLSAWLHALVIVGIPVDPLGGGPGSAVVISARIVSGAEEDARAAAVASVPEPVPGDEGAAPEVREPPAERASPSATDAAAARAESPLPGIEVPLIRDPTWYPARQLDVFPTPLAEIRFLYPPPALQERVSGAVTLLLLIDELGLVNEIGVVEATPAGYFEDAAREGFRTARFAPGMREGRAVRSRVMVQVKFEYGEDGAIVR